MWKIYKIYKDNSQELMKKNSWELIRTINKEIDNLRLFRNNYSWRPIIWMSIRLFLFSNFVFRTFDKNWNKSFPPLGSFKLTGFKLYNLYQEYSFLKSIFEICILASFSNDSDWQPWCFSFVQIVACIWKSVSPLIHACVLSNETEDFFACVDDVY